MISALIHSFFKFHGERDTRVYAQRNGISQVAMAINTLKMHAPKKSSDFTGKFIIQIFDFEQFPW